jgi:hypothetical protein
VPQEERSIFWEVIVSVILSKNVYMNMCPIPVSAIELFHCTDEQHAISLHELQSALMLRKEFSKIYYTRKILPNLSLEQ